MNKKIKFIFLRGVRNVKLNKKRETRKTTSADNLNFFPELNQNILLQEYL